MKQPFRERYWWLPLAISVAAIIISVVRLLAQEWR